ncbi:MAG: hypothetical protein RL477_579 [Pseudomonadota bacterium]|jgi:uncharacterized membrane protein YgdD (TMEM256/DUF423 family)
MAKQSLSKPALIALAFAGLCGAASVALGAAASHALADGQAEAAETASRYGLIHALAVVATTLVADRLPHGAARRLVALAAALFAAGIVLFSGGLAALAFGVNTGTAPAGSFALIAAWAVLALAAGLAVFSRKIP